MSGQRPRITGIEKIVFVFTLLAGALLLAAVPLWWRFMEATPQVSVPLVEAPSPNAYELYIEAREGVVDTGAVRQAIYRERKNRPVNSRWKIRKYSLADKKDLLARNSGPLKLARQAMSYEYKVPTASPDNPTAIYYSPFHQMGSLFTLDAQVKEEENDLLGAAQCHLDSIQMGIHIARGGSQYDLQLSTYLQATGYQALMELAPRLPARATRTITRRLESIIARRISLADALELQKREKQRELLSHFQGSDWRAHVLTNIKQNGFGSPPDAIGGRLERLNMEFASKQAVFNEYTNMMNALIAEAREPFSASAPVPQPNQGLRNLLYPEGSNLKFQSARDEVFCKLLQVYLAIHAYGKDKGVYPATLNALIPGYLKGLPSDPFGKRGPLNYKRTKDSFILYSVGPDGRDDGGATGQNLHMGGSSRAYVDVYTRGDIVAGESI